MKSSFCAETTILNHLHEGDLTSARRDIAEWRPSSERESLRHLYCQSKVFLYEGSYLKALDILQPLKKRNPQDLDVLCDIALCYYQLGLQTELGMTLSQARSLFVEQTPRLTSQKDLDHAVFLAKLLEERACYQEAHELLMIPTSELDSKQEQTLKVQLLRIAVELQNESTARSLYKDVISGLNHNQNFEVEREHTLLLADNFLFGLPLAWERFEYVISKNLPSPDLELLKSEMAELAIVNNHLSLLSELNLQCTSENGYEKIQAQLVGLFLQGATKPQISIVRLEKILSTMSLLRILRQVLLLFPQTLEDRIFTERYRFHCQSLPNRLLQSTFLAPLQTQSTPEFLVNAQEGTISINGRKDEIKSLLFWQLLKVFSDGRNEAPLDEVIEVVYQEATNAQHFDRLRIAIYRLNGLLEKKGQDTPLFRLTKNKVLLLAPLKAVAS